MFTVVSILVVKMSLARRSFHEFVAAVFLFLRCCDLVSRPQQVIDRRAPTIIEGLWNGNADAEQLRHEEK